MRKMIVAALVVASLFGCGCSNSDKVRDEMRHESEDNYGVMRTVTAYSTTGKQVGQWHGKIDVQYTDTSSESSYMQRVDLVIFDGKEPVDRIVISGGMVVVDND